MIWLLACWASAYLSPARFGYAALLGPTTAFAVMANLVFVVFRFLSGRWLPAIYSLGTLLLTSSVSFTILGLNYWGKNDMEKRPGTIKVISWNVHGMGVFNRPRDKEFEEEMLAFLEKEDADILCLPEYCIPVDDILKPHAKEIILNNGYKDYRFSLDNSLYNKVYFGTAVFSKFPFLHYQSHQLSEHITMLQGDIRLPNQQLIRVFFVHLTSFGLSDSDKDFIEDIRWKKEDLKGTLKESDRFIAKFVRAYRQRAREAEKAREIIDQSPYPVLLCGDFNDLPGSYVYRLMRGELRDAFLDKGKGFGRTYDRILPTLRIDHVFYDPEALKLLGMEQHPTRFSDHYPLITHFQLKAPPAPAE